LKAHHGQASLVCRLLNQFAATTDEAEVDVEAKARSGPG